MLEDVVPTRIVKGPPCTVCQALRALPESEADALQAMLINPSIAYTQISEALLNNAEPPLDIAHYTIGNHARGRCKARTKLRP